MKSSYDNFVGVYDDAFSADYCDALIEYFEWCKDHNMSFGRPEAERIKKDQSVLLNPTSEQSIEFSSQNVEPYLKEFNFRFWEVCYKEYTERYSALLKYERHTVYSYKIQRTDPAGGYHIWHAEDGSKELSRRVGVYILYLNDVEEGGETEFLYLSFALS